jgi:hypothetical protein
MGPHVEANRSKDETGPLDLTAPDVISPPVNKNVSEPSFYLRAIVILSGKQPKQGRNDERSTAWLAGDRNKTVAKRARLVDGPAGENERRRARSLMHDYELRSQYYLVEKFFDIEDTAESLYALKRRKTINLRSFYMEVMRHLYEPA